MSTLPDPPLPRCNAYVEELLQYLPPGGSIHDPCPSCSKCRGPEVPIGCHPRRPIPPSPPSDENDDGYDRWCDSNSDSDSGNEFEDHSSSVYIRAMVDGKRQHCNGSLVLYEGKVYVWTTAHGLLDSSQSSLPLHSDIRLSIQYASGGYLKLKWIRAIHSLHRFQQVEPPSKNEIDNGHDHMNGNDNGNDNTSGNDTELTRCFDVLIFELDPSHHGEQLMDRARLPFEGARDSDHGHPDLAGLAYVPSLFGSVLKDTGSEEYHSARAWSCVSSRMAFRDAQLGLGALHHIPFDRDWDEISGCGIGLFDRSKRLQGVMAPIVQLQSGKEKAIVILPSAFQHLLDNAAKRNDNVKIIEASSL